MSHRQGKVSTPSSGLSTEAIRVFVDCDSTYLRGALREATETDDRLAVARDARDADVLIYDRVIPFDRASGSRVQKRLLMYDERRPENALAILSLGFDGAVARGASQQELSTALFAVAAGHFVFSHTALSSFAATAKTELERDVHQPLTERETEVLRLMGNGKSNKAIGEALGVSEHTAKFHVGSILSKLGVETRTDAVRIGIKLGLIPL